MPTKSTIYSQLAKLSLDATIAVLDISKKVDLERTAATTAVIAGAMTIAGSAVHSWEVSQGLVNALPPNIGSDGSQITNIVTYIQECFLEHKSIGHNVMDMGLLGVVTIPVAAALNNIAINLCEMLPTVKSSRINEMSRRMVEYVQKANPVTGDQTKAALFEGLAVLEEQMQKMELTADDTLTILNTAHRELKL